MRKDESLRGLLTEEELAELLASSPQESGDDSQPAREEAAGGERERLAFLHWEKTIRELEREIVELRTRVSRLENELAQGEKPLSGDRLLERNAPGSPSSGSVPNEERDLPQPPNLSRVERLKSQRGRWF